ncbi:MAG TPA: glycoside hydrolase family 16 protein [Chitinophagaceae bacterium]|jgi:beta-glucanase (GH16 family)|nr:glycoside hydrolase family 16 protein [Chitinophagaceae bacterium]
MNKLVLEKSFYFLFTYFLLSCSSKSDPGDGVPPPPPPPPVTYEWVFGSTPVWTDEFSTDGAPDASKWGYDIGGNGWGNNELQYYTDGLNASINGGILKITAKKESYSGKLYTSARMITKNKADWLYGSFEIKAKLPKGRGTWPAIWMLPTESVYGVWPNSGEIDIMEHVGYDLNNVHFTLHANAFYGGNGKGSAKVIATATDDFHLYRLDWAPYGIRGYFDNEKVFEYTNPNSGYASWPYDKKFHMLLNIAVGGTWGGAQGVDDSVFPATMEIDYVRVYPFTR